MSQAHILSSLLLLILLMAPLMATPPLMRLVELTCAQSTNPELCHAVIPPLSPSATHYDLAVHVVKLGLEKVQETATVLSGSTGVLGHCLEMVEMAGEYLETLTTLLQPGEAAIGVEAADWIRTLMCATSTNLDTCMDTMHAHNLSSDEVLRASQLFDVALDLVVGALDSIDRIKTNLETSWLNKWAPTEPNDLASIIESVPSNQTVVVSKNGGHGFSSLQAAVDSIPENKNGNEGYYKIVIQEGKYRERVVIKKKINLILEGAGINRTVLTAGHSVGGGAKSTMHTATLEVAHSHGFIARGITFENTAGPENHQAVALTNQADRSVFYECSFLGYQDTLYAHSYRQFYRNCDIYGTVDFIFGDAAAVFQTCTIYARKPIQGQENTITAQGRRSAKCNTGISIHNCTIRAAPDLESSPIPVRTYLGRPWKEHSRVVIMQSFLDGLIDPAGWLEWNGNPPPDTLYYGEFNNNGRGSDTRNRVQWQGFRRMSESDALQFTVENFIAGNTWLPNTNVPFNPALL